MSDKLLLRIRSRSSGADMSSAIAIEMQQIVRKAAHPVQPGEMVAAQIRRAYVRLQVPFWRVREAWYGGAGTWSGPAIEKLRVRSRAVCSAGRLGPDNQTSNEKAARDELVELRARVARLEALLVRADTHMGRPVSDCLGPSSDHSA